MDIEVVACRVPLLDAGFRSGMLMASDERLHVRLGRSVFRVCPATPCHAMGKSSCLFGSQPRPCMHGPRPRAAAGCSGRTAPPGKDAVAAAARRPDGHCGVPRVIVPCRRPPDLLQERERHLRCGAAVAVITRDHALPTCAYISCQRCSSGTEWHPDRGPHEIVIYQRGAPDSALMDCESALCCSLGVTVISRDSALLPATRSSPSLRDRRLPQRPCCNDVVR
jgi:hypothetical protein